MTPQAAVSRATPVLVSLPAEPPTEDPRFFGVLSSRARMELLRAVTIREMTIADLGQELRLHRATVRYHLEHLLREGLVEEVPSASTGRVGRPAAVYRASRHADVASFPQRRFELLGRLALETLVEAVGEERASQRLRRKGINVSAAMIRMLSSQANVKRWTPETFERLILNGLFKEMGLVSEVRARGPDALVYRSFSCPFLELAEKMPEQVCDALDRGFHEGMDRVLGGVRTSRLACMGHGSPYCEYRVEWRAARRAHPEKPQRVGVDTEGSDEP